MSSTLKSVLTVRPARVVARAARSTLAPEPVSVIDFLIRGGRRGKRVEAAFFVNVVGRRDRLFCCVAFKVSGL